MGHFIFSAGEKFWFKFSLMHHCPHRIKISNYIFFLAFDLKQKALDPFQWYCVRLVFVLLSTSSCLMAWDTFGWERWYFDTLWDCACVCRFYLPRSLSLSLFIYFHFVVAATTLRKLNCMLCTIPANTYTLSDIKMCLIYANETMLHMPSAINISRTTITPAKMMYRWLLRSMT